MGQCSLCDLPVDDPVTASDVDGAFCCRGCLAVSRRLDEEDRGATVEDRTDGERSVEALETGPDTDADAVTGEEAFLAVDGMHCTTCEAFIEATATDHEGIEAAEASYAAELVKLVYDPETIDTDTLADAISGLGYRASLVEDAGDAGVGEQTQETVGRLLIGGFFGMMVMLWYVLFLYPTYLGADPSTLLLDLSGPAGGYLLGNIWVMTTVVIGYTGYPILRGAYVSLRAGEPNMDLLVALAASTAYVYSTIATLVGHLEVYFDVTVVIVLAVTLGTYYEGRIKDRATGTLADLTTDRVETARVRTGDGHESRSLDAVEGGDELVVRQGERVPLDGTVREGTAAADESLVTGESVPVRKAPGDEIVGGATVTDGGIVVEVDADETNTLDRVTERLWSLQSGHHGVQRLVDRLAGVFVPLVVVLAALATAWHLLTGSAPTAALLTGLAVLVVSCPCALGLATPLSVAAGVRTALDRGIVITDASVFERATEADVVAFDKTGTLTTGELTLADAPDDALLGVAAAVEQFADHPLAGAIVSAARERDDVTDPADTTVSDVTTEPGRGVGGEVDGTTVLVGHPSLFADRDWAVPDDLAERFEAASDESKVAALVGRDGSADGVLTAADTPRDRWEDIVEELAGGREVVVLTGDEGRAADRFRDHPAIEDVFAGVPPEAKGEIVERLRERGTVAMVGDGSNDAPALAAADVGIALAEGAPLAVDAADAVITTDDLGTVPTVFELTRATRRRIRQNIGWAFGYNAIALPVAIAGLLSPLVAAVAMAASSLLVVTNASRSLID